MANQLQGLVQLATLCGRVGVVQVVLLEMPLGRRRTVTIMTVIISMEVMAGVVTIVDIFPRSSGDGRSTIIVSIVMLGVSLALLLTVGRLLRMTAAPMGTTRPPVAFFILLSMTIMTLTTVVVTFMTGACIERVEAGKDGGAGISGFVLVV